MEFEIFSATKRSIHFGSIDMVFRLASSFPRILTLQDPENGMTLLHYAASKGPCTPILVDMLLTPENVGILDNSYETILHKASRKGNYFLLAYLNTKFPDYMKHIANKVSDSGWLAWDLFLENNLIYTRQEYINPLLPMEPDPLPIEQELAPPPSIREVLSALGRDFLGIGGFEFQDSEGKKYIVDRDVYLARSGNFVREAKSGKMSKQNIDILRKFIEEDILSIESDDTRGKELLELLKLAFRYQVYRMIWQTQHEFVELVASLREGEKVTRHIPEEISLMLEALNLISSPEYEHPDIVYLYEFTAWYFNRFLISFARSDIFFSYLKDEESKNENAINLLKEWFPFIEKFKEEGFPVIRRIDTAATISDGDDDDAITPTMITITAPHAKCPAVGCDLRSRSGALSLKKHITTPNVKSEIFIAETRRDVCDVARPYKCSINDEMRVKLREFISRNRQTRRWIAVDVHSFEENYQPWKDYEVVFLVSTRSDFNLSRKLEQSLRGMGVKVAIFRGNYYLNNIQWEMIQLGADASLLIEINDSLSDERLDKIMTRISSNLI